MEKSKVDQYKELVRTRKADKTNSRHEYKNQSDYPKYDSNEIGNYSLWANDLDADLMVIAQDYCDQETFEKCGGLIQKKKIKNPKSIKEWETKTNYYLWRLLKSINRDIGLPHEPRKAGVFLTNAVLDLKKGDMSEKVKKDVSHYSGVTYLKPLIEIVQPSKVITLGKNATSSLLRLYAEENNDYKKRAGISMKDQFRTGEFKIRNGETVVYPLYHPGQQGQSGRRQIESDKSKTGLDWMVDDWKSLVE